ncbi:MAG: polysaccharide pyruvyl transferase family protein [Flavobacteriia bacterium]|jgi:polysaccharide pyruvyl transferase WcaK-like protein
MKKYDIIVRGGYGYKNFGDDTLMYTICEKLRSSSREVSLFCIKEDYINKMLPDIKVVDYRFLNADFKSNLLVYGGGTQFYHFQNKQIKTTFFSVILKKLKNTVKFVLGLNFFENKFEIAKKSDFIAIVGVGVGPFIENSPIERKTSNLFRSASFISVRDKFAFNKSIEWGCKDVLLTPDLCYSFESKFLNEYKNNAKSVKTIGIIVRDWNNNNGGGDYYNKILNVNKTLEGNYKIKFISFDARSDVFWSNLSEDLNLLQWNPNIYTFDSFLKEISICDIFITARFHGAIFSTLLEKPFISIEIEQKLRFVSDLYSECSHCWKSGFDELELLNHVSDINSNYEDYVEKTTIITNKFKSQSDQMLSKLVEFCKLESYEKP